MNVAEDIASGERTALTVRNLSKHYGNGKVRALDDCSFTLPANCVIALVGANGAGKSTLIGIVSGMVRPTAGDFQVGEGGQDDSRVVLLSQDKPLYRTFSVKDMLAFGRNTNRVWDQPRAMSWLERFDIPLNRRCDKLSGGQQAQVSLALALGACPSLLLLDEPLANLDPIARRAVTGELLAEVADSGMTVILSTHVVAELAGVGDHLVLLSRGRNVLDGDIEELLAQHARLVGPPAARPPVEAAVVQEQHTGSQSTFIARTLLGASVPVDAPGWSTYPVNLEDVVLAYLKSSMGEALL